MRPPSFVMERELFAQGYRAIVGVDEVGCGALAGPVVAGAVVLPFNSRLGGIRDSKLLSESQRERMFASLKERVSTWAVAEASVAEILQLGLRQATLLAMRRALEQITNADFALVDAWRIPDISLPQRGVIHGDRLVKSIAAASIIAKVMRDRMMRNVAHEYPDYHFDVHKGYATEGHRRAIEKYGPCPIHRTSWKPFHSSAD